MPETDRFKTTERMIHAREKLLVALQSSESLTMSEAAKVAGVPVYRMERLLDSLSRKHPIWEESGEVGWMVYDD